MSAYWKIPLQALVLLVGILVFVFYQFTPPPLLFNPAHERAVSAGEPAAYASLSERYTQSLAARQDAATTLASDGSEGARATFRSAVSRADSVRTEALQLAATVTGQPSRDVNYIMPRFVLDHLPLGLAGLFIAAVLVAAMSSIAAELNALSTASVIDFYRRWVRPEATDSHFLVASRAATVFWGGFACVVATYAAGLGSLIEVVNRFGSYFYGSILGVFLLAMIPRAGGAGAFAGLLAGMATVWYTDRTTSIAFLWLNVVGAVTVVAVGLAMSLIVPREPRARLEGGHA
jgi:uncharacterized sodium:solute symporter family permease YidK